MFNPDHPFVFGPEFFEKYQGILLSFSNTFLGRYILRIHGKRSSVGRNKITQIIPNAIFWEEKGLKKVEFRTHNKYSKRLFSAFYYVWYAFHIWDTLFANNYNPALNLGFDTLTVFPSAGSASPVDGVTYRSGIDETFATIQAGAGTAAGPASAAAGLYLHGSATSSKYQTLARHLHLFDTSALTAAASIISAVYSAFGTTGGDIGGKANNIGSPDVHACSSNPASNANLVSGDFTTVGSTSYGSITYASLSTSSYNDITLDSNGLANISKTGISKFAMRLSWDINNSFTGVWSANAFSGIDLCFADTAGTTNDPKLVITYGGISPSASTSPSASRSPSASVSPSGSSSASRSPSASLSPSSSYSPSPSLSPSASSSASASPSASISSSMSPSSSVSASPSPGFSQYSRGDEVSLPTGTSDLETLYSETEEEQVAEDDNIRVGQTAQQQYMLHQFKNFVGSNTSCTVEWEGQSTLAPEISTVYLQVYNQVTHAWETIDSNNDAPAEIDFQLVQAINNLNNYKDSGQVITCRVYQLAI